MLWSVSLTMGNHFSFQWGTVSADMKATADIQMSEYLEKDEKHVRIIFVCYLKNVVNVCSTTVLGDCSLK